LEKIYAASHLTDTRKQSNCSQVNMQKPKQVLQKTYANNTKPNETKAWFVQFLRHPASKQI